MCVCVCVCVCAPVTATRGGRETTVAAQCVPATLSNVLVGYGSVLWSL